MNHPVAHAVGNPVPKLMRCCRFFLQTGKTSHLVALVPTVECAAWHIQFFQGLLDRQLRFLDQPDDFQLLRSGGPDHSSHSASCSGPSSVFFKSRLRSASSATNCLSCSFSRRIFSTSPLVAWRWVSPCKRAFPASRKSLLHL